VIDLIIADDQEHFRIEMERALKAADDIRLLAKAHSPEQLLGTLTQADAHLLILSTSFLPAFREIRSILEQRQTALLVLAEDHDRTSYIRPLGARGIVYRSMDGSALVDAMRRVVRGALFIQSRSFDTREERALYICYDPGTLIVRERLLVEMGYEVRTVLGNDGLMAMEGTDYFDFALVGDEGTLAERESAVSLLKKTYPHTPVIVLCRDSERIPETDYHISADDPETWPDKAGIGKSHHDLRSWRRTYACRV